MKFPAHNIVVLVLFITYLLIGVSIFDDYGISWDEPGQRNTGGINFRYVFEEDRQLLDYKDRYYGPVFEVLLILLEKAFHLDDSRDIYLMRHLVTFLVFYIGVFFFYLLCKQRFHNWKIGLLGSLFFILSPRIFADSFYNSKDIPFLSIFIISIYTLLTYLHQKTWLRAILHAFSCAMLVDIRILGILVPCFTFLFTITDLISDRSTSSIKNTVVTLMQYSIVLVVVTIFFFPLLWEKPVHYFIQAFGEMKKYPWDGAIFYLGKYIRIPRMNVPWHYIPVWFIITTPILYICSFLAGVIVFASDCLKNPLDTYRSSERKSDLIFFLWFFLPLLSVIVLKSVVYDAWRHLFFIYPAFVIIALYGVLFLWRMITSKVRGQSQRILRLTFVLLILLGLAEPIYFMIRYHPYQNIYFNRLAGKDMVAVQKKFDLDYWGLSYRKALEYILKHDSQETIPIHVAELPGKLNAEILRAVERKRLSYVDKKDEAQYFVSTYRFHKDEYDPDKEDFFSVKIGNAKIVVVYKLP